MTHSYSLSDLCCRVAKRPLVCGWCGDEGLRTLSRGQKKWKRAAVLLLFFKRNGLTYLILTKRDKNLRDHAGQIAFPGGKIDKQDKSVAQAALRETCEEIGIRAKQIEILGALPRYYTLTGFVIYPVIGYVRAIPHFCLNTEEVTEILEVPLQFLMDRQQFHKEAMLMHSQWHHFYRLSFAGNRIWGATAGIIRVFYERFYSCEPQS